MAFNNRSTWVNFVKKPYIDGTSKPIIVTSADAAKTPLLEADYTRQDEQRWDVPDAEAEAAYLNMSPKASKSNINDALGWYKEMYLKMRHDAVTERNDFRQKLHVANKELVTLKAGSSNGVDPFSTPGAVDAPAPRGFSFNSAVIGAMVAFGTVLAAIVGMNFLG